MVCTEFNCLPDEADRQDTARIRHILNLRRFFESWTEVESGKPQAELTKGPMLEKVLLVQIKRAKGEID